MGLVDPRARREHDYRFAWWVILATVPVVVAGLLFQSLVKGPLASLWVVAVSLIVGSGVMGAADRFGTGKRGEAESTLADALLVGASQILVLLLPGLSRSGATISTGLLRGLDRVAATRLSFFLSILREHAHFPPAHGAVAGHHGVTPGPIALGAPAQQGTGFGEGAGVEQRVHALARGTLARPALPLGATPLAFRLLGLPAAQAEHRIRVPRVDALLLRTGGLFTHCQEGFSAISVGSAAFAVGRRNFEDSREKRAGSKSRCDLAQGVAGIIRHGYGR